MYTTIQLDLQLPYTPPPPPPGGGFATMLAWKLVQFDIECRVFAFWEMATSDGTGVFVT